MNKFLHNRRKLNEIRLAKLLDLIDKQSPLTYGEAEEIDQETSLELMFHNPSLLTNHKFIMSNKIKALITDVLPVSIKDKDMKPTILILNAEHFVDTFQGTLENFKKVLGEEGALALLKSIKTKFREQDPEKMKDVISAAQIADEKVKWPNAEQWANLVAIIREVAAMKSGSVITPKSYNRYQLVAGRVVDAVSDETAPFRGDSTDAAAHLEAINSVLIGIEAPADPKVAAEELAKANGKTVESKPAKQQPAATAPKNTPPAAKTPETEQLPNPPANNLPATPAQVGENPLFTKIADNIRQRMEDLKADEASIDIIEQQLAAIKQRAGRERGSILEDLQAFYQAVSSAPTATAAVEAGNEVAASAAVTVEKEEEEEVGI